MSEPIRRPRPATYEDLLRVPDHLVAEIIDGELFTTPRPAPRHADAQSGLGGVLRRPFDRGRGGPGGWRILDEPELHLGDDIVVPDLAGWGRERLPMLPTEAYFTLAPDWICEVISPLDGRTGSRQEARALCTRTGPPRLACRPARPDARGAEARRRAMDHREYLGRQRACVAAEPFEALESDLIELWDEPSPPGH
jgi:hypothetical protein